MSAVHGLRFDATRFWVIHRRRAYGPFDYEWSADLYGLEMLYDGCKFGEVCSAAEVFADLKEFRLPSRVVEVASLVFGCTLYGIVHGLDERERRRMLGERLREHGCGAFVPVDEALP
jgi:hypothetical protein